MEQDVTRGIEEQLSAFLDGELPDEEVALLVRRLDREESYRDTLASYAAVGSVLRGEAGQLAALNVREAVRAGIAAAGAEGPGSGEPAQSAAAQPIAEAPNTRRSLLPYAAAAGVAVAALAALLVTLGGPDGPATVSGTGGDVRLQAAAQPGLAAPEAATVVRTVTASTGVSAEEAVRIAAAERRVRLNRERMTSYLIAHGEHARSFPGSFADSRMYVQQANFSE